MYLIKEIPVHERPRERLALYGVSYLSNAELLAIILRTGSKNKSAIHLAEELLYKKESLHDIAQMPVEELTTIEGIGISKAAQIHAAFELSRRLLAPKTLVSPKLISPEQIYQFVRSKYEMKMQEHFIALFLSTKGKLIKCETLFIGSLNSSLVHPREIFKKAVMYSAAAFIIFHNHLSGDPIA